MTLRNHPNCERCGGGREFSCPCVADAWERTDIKQPQLTEAEEASARDVGWRGPCSACGYRWRPGPDPWGDPYGRQTCAKTGGEHVERGSAAVTNADLDRFNAVTALLSAANMILAGNVCAVRFGWNAGTEPQLSVQMVKPAEFIQLDVQLVDTAQGPRD